MREAKAVVHELECDDIDSLDEIGDGEQLARVWCRTCDRYEWRWLDRCDIGRPVTEYRRGDPSL